MINETDFHRYDNKEAAQFLASHTIRTIKHFSSAKYNKSIRNSSPSEAISGNTNYSSSNKSGINQRNITAASNIDFNRNGNNSQSISRSTSINELTTVAGNHNINTPSSNIDLNQNYNNTESITRSTSNNNLTRVAGNYNNSSTYRASTGRTNLNITLENEITNNRMSMNDSSIVVEWDYDHSCLHCGCIYLKSEKNRVICCWNGKANRSVLNYVEEFPQLLPLSPIINSIVITKGLLVVKPSHFRREFI